jgi:hypothetical protein
LKPSQFQVNAPKRRSNYNHLKSGSTEDFNPNSTSELKHFDGANTMCSSPNSPRSIHRMMAQLDPIGKEANQTPPSRWQKFKEGLSQPSATKRFIGKVLMLVVALGSVYLILKISTNSSGNSWPWGFWYVAALTFDQCLFQPLTSLAQFYLLNRYVKNCMKKEWKEAPFTRLVIGKDIMAIVESKLSLDK